MNSRGVLSPAPNVEQHRERFPEDFMFRLTVAEKVKVITSRGHLHRTRGHHGSECTQQSPRAVQMSVFVVRAFIRMRTALAGTRELAHKLAELERRIGGHDASIRTLFDAIRQLMAQSEKAPRSIGFRVERQTS